LKLLRQLLRKDIQKTWHVKSIKQIQDNKDNIKTKTLLSDNVYTTDSSDLAGILSILRNRYAFSKGNISLKTFPQKKHTNVPQI